MTRVTSLNFCNAADNRGISSPCRPWGKGVEELRVGDDSGTYRVIYTARLADATYVLHAFRKKTRATSKRDIEIAKERFSQLMRERK